MRTDVQAGGCGGPSTEPAAGRPPSDNILVITYRRGVLLAAVGCARPGWQVRACGDPGRLRHVPVEWDVPRHPVRRPAPAWVREWVRQFARR